MSDAKVIELRRMLSERFPKFRDHSRPPYEHHENTWPTGLAQVDSVCGGLPKGALTELVGEHRHCGSATLMRGLLRRAAGGNQILTVIDGADSLDVTQLETEILQRLLWVRCRSADEALKAADLVLRDNNLPLVALDLMAVARPQLRRIPATVWYRFQRLLEDTSTICLVFTPLPMITPAVTRLVLRSHFSLPALETPPAELLRDLDIAVVKNHAAREAAGQTLAG